MGIIGLAREEGAGREGGRDPGEETWPGIGFEAIWARCGQ